MNNLRSEANRSRDHENSLERVGDFHEISWATQEPLRADGSPEKDYLQYIRSQRCARCGRLGGKAQRIVLDGWWCVPGHELSDAYLLPLCEDHDRELTNAPNKSGWWLAEGFRPLADAAWLWEFYHATAEQWMWREEAKAKREAKNSK